MATLWEIMNPETIEPEETPSASSYQPLASPTPEYLTEVEKPKEPQKASLWDLVDTSGQDEIIDTESVSEGAYATQREAEMGTLERMAYNTGRYFSGSGIPTAVSGLTSWYYSQNERIGDLLGLEDFEGYAKAKKEYWDTLRQDFQVEGFESSVIDNPMLLLDPRWYNYQIGKMAPAMAAGAATGGLAGGGVALGSVVTGVTMSAPEAALVFDEVLKETGDKQAAYASSMYNFAINTTLESFGFSKLWSITGKPLTRYAKGAVTEGGTEFQQSLLNDIQQTFWTEAAKGSSVPEITEKLRQDFPQMLKESIAAGVAGGAIGGVLGGISPSERNSARQVLRDLGVPEDQLVEPEVEIDPNSEIGRVMSRLDSENSLSSVDIRQTEEVPTATEVLEETPLETLPTEQSPQGTATEQGVQQPTETQEALGQVDTEALPSTEDSGVTQEPSVAQGRTDLSYRRDTEIDPRLESVLNPPEETQPDISAVEALDEAVEAAPLGVDREFSIRGPKEPLSRLDLEMEEATDVGPKAPMIFNEEEMSLISKEENQTITRLVEFLDNNERPSQASLLKTVNNAIVGSRTAATYGRGDVSITVADKIREHFAEKLGPEGVKGPMASLFQKVGREDFTQAVRDIIQTEREKIVGPYRERQGTQGKLEDSSVKGLGGVQDTGTSRDTDTSNTPSTYSPLPDPSISISQSSQPYSPETEGTITEQQGDKVIEKNQPVDTKSVPFQKWFKKSVAAFPNGKPYAVYHGTNSVFDKFKVGAHKQWDKGTDSDWTAHGLFFGNQEVANTFATSRGKERGGAPSVIPVYLSIQNPIDLMQGFKGLADLITDPEVAQQIRENEAGLLKMPWSMFHGDFGKQVVADLKANGYDGAMIREQNSRVFVAFDESQVKEALSEKTKVPVSSLPKESKSFKDDIYRAPTTPEELRLVTDKEDKDTLRKIENSQNWKQASAFSPLARKLGILDRLIKKANRESPVADKNVAVLLNRLGVDRVRQLVYESLSEHRRAQVIQNRVDKQSVQPTGKPLEQLNKKMEEAHEKAGKKAKRDEPLTEEQRVKAGEKLVAATDKYMETNDPDKEVKDSEREKTKRDLGTKAQRAFQESMSILEGIHPRLAGLMKRFEAAVMNNTKERLDRGNDFYKVYKKLDPRERQLMKKAWVNYHKPGARKTIDDYSKQNPEFGKAFAEARAIVDEITGEAMATGIIGKNRKYYLPARVRDLDGLLTFIAEHAKPEKAPVAKELQDVMATSEENPSATSITSMMSEYLGREVKTYEEAKAEFGKLLERGFMPTMFLNPSSGRGRQIWNVTDGMLTFYYDPAESLELHIKEMTEAIEQRKLVGVSRKGKYQDELDTLTKKLIKEPQDYDRIRSLQQAIVAEDSMDRLTEDVTDVVTKATIEGGLSIRDQKMAIDVFKDRFNQKRLGKFLAGLKDLSLASALGQGLSTITQLADFAPMVIRQGFWNSVQAMNADKSFKKEEIDTNSANTEWANSSKTSKFLDGLLTGTGFKATDSFFATASMEAALIKAKKTSWGEFNKNYKHIFGKDTRKLFDDIQNGEKTKLAKEFAVIELSETRPLFPTNMPPSFLVGGDNRILYALKGWNLKTANNLYRDIRKAQREGGMSKATYVGLKNIAILALAGASAEAIKDLVLGNPVDLEDNVIDSVLKIVFLSRYSLGEFKRGNFDEGFVDYFTPPLNYLKRPVQDIHDAISEDGKFTFETLKEMPAVGRWLHARFTPYGQKARLDKEREALFGLLKDATLERDQKLMVEFHKKRRAYNEKVRGIKQDGGSKELKTIDTDSISRAKKRYREAENKRRQR